MLSNVERIEALEKQNAMSPEVLDVLLEFARILDYHTGYNMKPLKRRIKALRNRLPPGQQHFKQPKA